MSEPLYLGGEAHRRLELLVTSAAVDLTTVVDPPLVRLRRPDGSELDLTCTISDGVADSDPPAPAAAGVPPEEYPSTLWLLHNWAAGELTQAGAYKAWSLTLASPALPEGPTQSFAVLKR